MRQEATCTNGSIQFSLAVDEKKHKHNVITTYGKSTIV